MNFRLALHLGFWLLYLLVSAYISASLGNQTYNDEAWTTRMGVAGAEKIGIIAIQASVFYWLFYSLLPKYKKVDAGFILKIFGLVILSVALYRLWIGQVLYPLVYKEDYPGNPFTITLMFFSFLNIYSFVGIAGAIKLFRSKQQQRIVEQQLVKEKLESELHFLRAQINPHFFFNTLNNIYGLARKQSVHTAEVVMRLSKLMRFILYECTSKYIPIGREIKVLEDYIELEKIRYDKRLSLSFIKEVDNLDQNIAPLLLLPFVENSFKHGASEMRFESSIELVLRLQNKRLQFSVFNEKEADYKNNESGLGLQNVRRQLELIYPEKYELQIDEGESYYKVELMIELN